MNVSQIPAVAYVLAALFFATPWGRKLLEIAFFTLFYTLRAFVVIGVGAYIIWSAITPGLPKG